MSNHFWAVVPAAGVGKRMGTSVPKQYLEVQGKTVLEHTLERLLSVSQISAIAVALGVDDGYWNDLPVSTNPRIIRAAGGRERSDSVYSALQRLEDRAKPDDWVLVHDAARLCITRTDIENLIDTLQHDLVGAFLLFPLVIPSKPLIKDSLLVPQIAAPPGGH